MASYDMDEAVRQENLREVAQATFDTLSRVHDIVDGLYGDYVTEVREDVKVSGTVDELSLILCSTRRSVELLLEKLDTLSGKI